jgi:dihydropteroate synthase type 2
MTSPAEAAQTGAVNLATTSVAAPSSALPGDPAVTGSRVPVVLPAGRPSVVGIVNITEDSFSDGGRYLAAAKALAHARRLRSEGADIIELGPAASHPGAVRVTTAEEQRRLAPVLGPLAEEGIPVSVDSVLPGTQRFAISRGAAYLNDIQGFPHPGLYETLASSRCRLVVMHSVQRTGPATRMITDPAVVWAGIGRFFARRLDALHAAGMTADRLVIDPGLGYFLGSNPQPSLAALARIRELKARFGLPVLVSPSRKSFLRTLTGCTIANAGPASLAAELHAASCGADYIRTHDVAALRDALTVLTAIAGQARPDPAHPNARRT